MKSSTLSFIKLILLVAAISALLGVVIGNTLALFTDSKSSEGIFTLGNVYIELTEAAVKPDDHGNLIEDPDAERIYGADTTDGGLPTIHNYGLIFPGQTIYKDPVITNIGDTRAWMAAKVIVEDGNGDIHKLFSYSDDYDDIDIEHFLSGGLLDESVYVGAWNGFDNVCYNKNYVMLQHADRAAGRYEFFFLMLSKIEPDASFEVFDTFFIDPYFGGSEMMELKEFKITVHAFATQTAGFKSCYEAMTEGFPEHFAGIMK